ncbi:MAG: FAD-dependent oxidoreductase [bacterium]
MASPPKPPTDLASTDTASTLPRRDFLKAAGAGAGLLLLGGCTPAEAAVPGLQHKRRLPLIGGSSSNVVVIGAGVWGGWTALHLRKMGASVTLVDAYGPGNARATSGDETRGIRSSYGDRDAGELWVQWAREGLNRWKAFDAEWSADIRQGLWHTTGDLIMREEPEPFTVKTKEWWDKHKVPHEVLSPDEVRYRWPVINVDGITVVLSEPDAGVIRARRATQTVAAAFEALGGKIRIGRARPSKVVNGKLEEIALDTGHTLRADTFVFALGPWLGKMFPDVLNNRTRTPLGYVCYFATPASDERFTYPNLPSWNFPGVTGWAALPIDNRGFRVRGSARPRPAPGTVPPPPGTPRPAQPPTPPEQLDPDLSDRWCNAERIAGPRRVLEQHFPLLANAPISQTHSCHYELTSTRDFIIDRHPRMSNVWIAGGGNAEGFKFGPVVGEYVAQRALGDDGDPEIAKRFRIPAKEYDPVPPPTPAAAGAPVPTPPLGTRSRPSR